MGSRPTAMIKVEMQLINRAIGVCNDLSQRALSLRKSLLEDGWPVSHALCQLLDETAAQWTAHANQQRADFNKLDHELNGTD